MSGSAPGRWDELVTGGYINPAGGILEQCKVQYGRDEGCAIVDWLRLNLALGRVTGKTRYWAMAERTLHNHFLQNQSPKGGFGHRGSLCDQEGVYGFRGSIVEAVWCCTFHGQLGFVNLRSHLLSRTAGELTCNFALAFTAKYADGSLVSEIRPVAAAGEVLRQRLRLDGLSDTVLRVRQPHWANAVTAVAADGSALPLVTKDGFCATTRPVSEATFIYAGLGSALGSVFDAGGTPDLGLILTPRFLLPVLGLALLALAPVLYRRFGRRSPTDGR